MSRIEDAKIKGCLHCFSKNLEETTIDNEQVLICKDCKCEHREHEYKYGISVAEFLPKNVSWKSYREVQEIVEQEEKSAIPECIT
jgi:hypothetical protein